jgi:2-desacetyl-2-hydroxyethyl bacteriochlorophyllide A dehydrogenase
MNKKTHQLNIQGPDILSLDLVDYPSLGSNDLIVAIKCCGICGTDLSYLSSGGLMGPQKEPMPLGHEMSGIVIEIGSDIKDINVNDRVAINPMGNNNSIGNGGLEGGMTNFLLVKNAVLNKSIFKLPDDMSFEIGALVEPFAVALRTINRSNLDPDSKIGVCGLGCIGFSVVTLLSYFGYKNIIAVDLYNLRVLNANNLNVVKAYTDWESFSNALKEFHGEGEVFGIPVSNTDVFIDCTGNHKLISNIINISKKHTRIVVTGLHQEEALIDFRSVLMRELEITCSMAYSNKEFSESLEILSKDIFDQSKFISHKCKIQDHKKAFELAKDGNLASKVMIDLCN